MAQKRAAIVTSILAKLAAINGAGSYGTTVVTAVAWRSIPLNADQQPGTIARDRDAAVLEPQGIQSPYNKTDWRMLVDIELVLQGATDVQMRTFIKDVYIALGTDETFGGNAILADPVGDRMIVSQEEQRIDGAIVTIAVRYRTTKWQES